MIKKCSFMLSAIALGTFLFLSNADYHIVSAEEVATEAVAPTEETTTEVVTPAEAVATEAVAPTEETTTEVVTPAEEVATEAVTPAEEVAPTEGGTTFYRAANVTPGAVGNFVWITRIITGSSPLPKVVWVDEWNYQGFIYQQNLWFGGGIYRGSYSGYVTRIR